MTEAAAPAIPAALPEPARRALEGFLESARGSFGADLVSAVLFGSGAEGALRPESDLNVVLVLKAFPDKGVGELRGALRAAQSAARLEVMFLLESEVSAAAEAFAVKFADIGRRRIVLLGRDPFEGLKIPDESIRRRLSQSLLNLSLRLREAWAAHGGNDDEAARSVSNFAGPLRASAASILSLEGVSFSSPKEALRRIAAALPGDGWPAIVENLSAVRERRPLPAGEAARILSRLSTLADLLRARARGAA